MIIEAERVVFKCGHVYFRPVSDLSSFDMLYSCPKCDVEDDDTEDKI